MKLNRPKLLITAHIESFISCYEEMQALNKKHYNEISEHKKRGIALEPDYQRYFDREQAGELLYVTLRHEGLIVGYFIGFIMPDLHYKNCLRLFQDILYIDVQCRGQNALPMLLKLVKDEAKLRGCRLFTCGYKDAHKLHMARALVNEGFEPFETHMVYWF
jgi:hypothetical protein